MLYSLSLMQGETNIWSEETRNKLSNLINKVDTPFYNGTGMYDDSYGRYIESWEAAGIYD